MAENYKHLYEQTKKMLTMYQDELIPGFRKQIEDLEAKSKWIPVTERLPDKNRKWVLCLCVGGAMEVLNFDFTMWNWDSQYPGRCYMEKYVTHWMPLPEPPKEVE